MGWKPTFERRIGMFSSIKELKEFYENNKEQYEIIDEYGRVFDWDGLKEELIEWNGERENLYDGYKDSEGFIWAKHQFS